MEAGRVSAFRFESRVLAGNPLGDPTGREVWTWEPPASAGTGPWPVLYGLTGYTGNGAAAFQGLPWNPGLGPRLDHMLAEGRIRPMLVAFPDCFTRLGGSQYVNSTATGRYRDYVTDEVIPEVERRFPVLAGREHRSVFGKSSGGFGAISLGMDRPDLFGGVACHSGDMAFEYSYFAHFSATVGMLVRHGGIEGLLRAFDSAPRKTTELIEAVETLAMAACYSPDRGRPGAYELPFEVPTGRVRPEVWERWLALDPARRAAGKIAELKSLRALFIDCGSRDEFQLHLGARMLHETLEQHAVPHVYEEFDDGHMSIAYRYERSIPFLSQAFA